MSFHSGRVARYFVFGAWIAGAVSVLLISACATSPGQAPDDTKPYKASVKQAFAELSQMERQPAQNNNVAFQNLFLQLRKEKTYLVFPIQTNLTERSNEAVSKLYGAPQEVRVTAPRLVSCKQIKVDPAKTWNHKAYFANAPDEKNCAILRYTFGDRLNRDLLGVDDILEVRLYVDSDYHGYGIDFVKFKNRNETVTVTQGLDAELAISSGLTLLPTDIPLLEQLNSSSLQKFDLPRDRFVQSVLTRLNERSGCSSALAYTYKETFGNQVRGAWCEQDALPTFVMTNRYLAVLRKSQ